ncbi:uncharacterized protein CBL_11265 [Carabus blaptoides fortunei]
MYQTLRSIPVGGCSTKSSPKMKLVIVTLAAFLALCSALPSHRLPANRGLKEDFQKFLALIPKDKVLAIAMNYLANDVEIQDAVIFLQSDDFKSLVLEVETIPEYNDFVKYLTSQGLDVVGYINKLHELLDLPEYAVSRAQFRSGTGIRGLIDDIKAVLPIDDIKALYYETLRNSPDFANLVNVLKGDEFKGLVAKLRANPTFQEIVERARDKGVDIELIIDLLNKIFGWGIEERNMSVFGLQDDLQDFLALVPKDEVIAIVFDYLANDAEVQGVLEFAQSDDFMNLVLEVDEIPEYIKFLNTLQSKGLDVYRLVNALHDFLGLPTLPVPSRMVTRRGQGVRGLLDDIKAILPIEKIKALFYEKLVGSPDFAGLVEFMKSNEFQTIVKALQANPKFQEIIDNAKGHGVDVQLIIDLLHKIFGWDLDY